MTPHTRARVRAPRGKESMGAAIETALGFVLWSLRERGVVMWIGRRAIREAAHMLHLNAGGPVPGWKAPAGLREYCEAAGIDPVSGRVIDWEKFYAAMERSSPNRVS